MNELHDLMNHIWKPTLIEFIGENETFLYLKWNPKKTIKFHGLKLL